MVMTVTVVYLTRLWDVWVVLTFVWSGTIMGTFCGFTATRLLGSLVGCRRILHCRILRALMLCGISRTGPGMASL